MKKFLLLVLLVAVGSSIRGQDFNQDYLVITPDKKVLSIFNSGGDIGKLGVLLQEYFSEKPSNERPD